MHFFTICNADQTLSLQFRQYFESLITGVPKNKLKRLCVGMSVFTWILDKELTNIAASNISSEFSLRCTYLKQF